MKKHIEVINLVESNAVTNGIFSFFIPGLGQAIEGYKLRGAIFFIIAVIISGVFIYFPFESDHTSHNICCLRPYCSIRRIQIILMEYGRFNIPFNNTIITFIFFY